MAGEVYAIMDSFDKSFVIKKDLQSLLGISLDTWIMTDSRQLFDSVTKGKMTAERRLSIDSTARRESYHNFEMPCIGIIRGKVNPADDLTKACGNGTLRWMMESGIDDTPLEQRLLREEK